MNETEGKWFIPSSTKEGIMGFVSVLPYEIRNVLVDIYRNRLIVLIERVDLKAPSELGNYYTIPGDGDSGMSAAFLEWWGGTAYPIQWDVDETAEAVEAGSTRNNPPAPTLTSGTRTITVTHTGLRSATIELRKVHSFQCRTNFKLPDVSPELDMAWYDENGQLVSADFVGENAAKLLKALSKEFEATGVYECVEED